MIKVLFVCLGNICRSPMAQALFEKMIRQKNLQDKIIVDSVATSTWEQGNPVHKGTKKILAKEGINSDDMYSRTIEKSDLDSDYIVVMDSENLKDINSFINKNNSVNEKRQVKKLLFYANSDKDVADPWYTGDFEETYKDIYKGCQYLLEKIISENNL